MISVKVRNKTNAEVQKFLIDHKRIYPIHLVYFLDISDRHARRVLEQIKKQHGIKDKYIESKFLEEYLDVKEG